jgi:hypothetical protein
MRGLHPHPSVPTLMAGAASVLVAGVWLVPWPGPAHVVAFGEPSPPAEHTTPDPYQFFSLDGTTPLRAPATRTGLAFLDLDEPLQPALDVFGPPAGTTADINATTAHTWALPGGAELTVITDRSPQRHIVGLFGAVLPTSPVRLPLQHHVTVGQTTASGVLATWNAADAIAADHLSDYRLAYALCRGPFPVVVKLDQAAPSTPGGWLDQPFTSVLIAYSDDGPGTAGCPLPAHEL